MHQSLFPEAISVTLQQPYKSSDITDSLPSEQHQWETKNSSWKNEEKAKTNFKKIYKIKESADLITFIPPLYQIQTQYRFMFVQWNF